MPIVRGRQDAGGMEGRMLAYGSVLAVLGAVVMAA